MPNGINRGMKHLGPLIEERIKQEAQYGENWPDKPVSDNFVFRLEILMSIKNDAISWLLEFAKEPHRRTVRNLTTRILIMNFAGIHTTTMVCTSLTRAYKEILNVISRSRMHFFIWLPVLNIYSLCAKRSRP